MRQRMSMTTRRELQASMSLKYQNADRAQRKEILSSFLEATGYSRKHAIAMLLKNNGSKPKRKEGSGRPSRLGPEALAALVSIWHFSQHLCGKRLAPIIADYLENLAHFDELALSEPATRQLEGVSAATIDRLLKKERSKLPRSISHTKRGSFLKDSVPIRTFTEWNDVVPGFFEIDTVSHSGSDINGPFLSTLNMTDIATGWTIPIAIFRKSSLDIISALEQAQKHIPFPVLGIDFDNGSEFLNQDLIDWCRARSITYTRSRPYKKNDQAWIEEKNRSVVRSSVGRDRYVGKKTFKALSELYPTLIHLHNFFQPSQKLLSKSRHGAKVYKLHDTARTPYQRVLDNPNVSSEAKADLRKIKERLNIADLSRRLNSFQNALRLLAVDIPNPVIAARIAQRNAVYKFSSRLHEPARDVESKQQVRVSKKIKELIVSCEIGSIVRAEDFMTLGSRNTVNVSLLRLNKRGKLERISHGIYQIPAKVVQYPTPNLSSASTNNFEATI